MRLVRHCFYLLVTLVIVPGCGGERDSDAAGPAAGLFVNEFVAANASGLQDEGGAFPDWIELWNSTDEPIDLTDWTLTDDLTLPAKWAFAAATQVEPGGYVVILADGDAGEGPLHANFRLDAEVGEDLGLFDAEGEAADQLSYGPQAGDISHARTPDGGAWAPDPTPTPGARNQ